MNMHAFILLTAMAIYAFLFYKHAYTALSSTSRLLVCAWPVFTVTNVYVSYMLMFYLCSFLEIVHSEVNLKLG